MGPSAVQGFGERWGFAASFLILSHYHWEGSCALKVWGKRRQGVFYMNEPFLGTCSSKSVHTPELSNSGPGPGENMLLSTNPVLSS